MSLVLALSLFAALVAAMLCANAAARDLNAKIADARLIAVAFIALLALALSASGIRVEQALALSALALTCVLIVEIDRRLHLIPDPLVAALVVLTLAKPFGDPILLQAIGATMLGLLFLGVRQLFSVLKSEDALGLGDVKLAAAMGALLGPQFGLIAIALGGVSTIAVLGVRATRGGAVATGAPFGVGLAAALFCVALFRVLVRA